MTPLRSFGSDMLAIQNVEDFRKAIKSLIGGTNKVSGEAIQNSVSAFLEQTGLIDEAVDILKDELKCAVCLEISLRPCLTECHHIFCKYCRAMLMVKSDLDDGKWECPMCRTQLPPSSPSCLPPETEMIIDAVMSKHNSQYIAWKEQQLIDRSRNLDTVYLRGVHDKLVEFLEKLRSKYGVEKYKEELGNLAQELQLSIKRPISKANEEQIRKNEQQLCISARDIITAVSQHLESSVDKIESLSLSELLSYIIEGKYRSIYS